VDLDNSGAEIHQPGLRDAGFGVAGQLDVTVEPQRGIGDLYHEGYLAGSRQTPDRRI
jgi:hypothetical protein